MKLYGLLGHKIGYSLSPAMHNAALKKLNLKAEYRLFDIGPRDLDNFLKGILRSDIKGLNVTVPYKQLAYNFCKIYGTIDRETERYGAINTIVIKNKSLFGYNTDIIGFIESLKKDLDFNPRLKNIFVFGVGGAGTACTLKLARAANKIYIHDIDTEKVKNFKTRFLEYFGKSKLTIVGNRQAEIQKALSKCQLLVNATPFGRKTNEILINPDFLHKDLKIMDLIYKPKETPIMKLAQKKGLKAIGGIGMLLYQGAASFELWTGRKAPLEVMHTALKRALKK